MYVAKKIFILALSYTFNYFTWNFAFIANEHMEFTFLNIRITNVILRFY